MSIKFSAYLDFALKLKGNIVVVASKKRAEIFLKLHYNITIQYNT